MGKITTLFVRKVLEEIDSDIDKNAWMRSMGIELNRPVHMISDAHYYSFFERAAAIDRNGTTLPLRTGAAMLRRYTSPMHQIWPCPAQPMPFKRWLTAPKNMVSSAWYCSLAGEKPRPRPVNALCKRVVWPGRLLELYCGCDENRSFTSPKTPVLIQSRV